MPIAPQFLMIKLHGDVIGSVTPVIAEYSAVPSQRRSTNWDEVEKSNRTRASLGR